MSGREVESADAPNSKYIIKARCQDVCQTECVSQPDYIATGVSSNFRHVSDSWKTA